MDPCSSKECGQGEVCSPAWACLFEGGNLGLDLKRYAQGALAWALGVGRVFVHWSEGGAAVILDDSSGSRQGDPSRSPEVSAGEKWATTEPERAPLLDRLGAPL